MPLITVRHLLIEMIKRNKIKFYLTRSIFFCFRGASDPIYKAIWADNKSFDEVLISKRMVQDHMPDNVLGALEKVRFTKWGQNLAQVRKQALQVCPKYVTRFCDVNSSLRDHT